MKLYKVEIPIKYLIIGDTLPKHSDILKCLRNIRSGEIEDLAITEVVDKRDIEDFDMDYVPYSSYPAAEDTQLDLESLIIKLKLDIPEMIRSLKRAGYEVSKEKK